MLLRENFPNESISGWNLNILWRLFRNYLSGEFESFIAIAVLV